MAAGPSEVLTPIWQGVSLAKSTTGGTITSLGGTDFTIQSTSGATWNLNVLAGGNNSLFKKWNDLIGKRIKVELDVENLYFVNSSASIVMAIGFFNGLTSSSARHGYKEFYINADGYYNIYLDVTADLDGWTNASSTTVNDYFTWRLYLHSSSGSYATIKNIKGYIVT